MIIYKTNNDTTANFLFMYCEGKSALWNMFFGWQGTKGLPNGGNSYTFKIPRKIYQMAEKFAEESGTEIITG